MPTFTLDGTTYDYLRSEPGPGEDPRSWEYGHEPKVSADVPLAGGGTVTVYATANRWTATQLIVSWFDDDGHPHWAWVPSVNVRRVTASEWDIDQYRRCPANLRHIRWGNRLPGFLPE